MAGYADFKLVDQTLARSGYAQFSGGHPEEALAHVLDPKLDNVRAGWTTAAEIRELLSAINRSPTDLTLQCDEPPDVSEAGYAQRWGPCKVERCMLSEFTDKGAPKQSCVPRKRDYDLHARRRHIDGF